MEDTSYESKAMANRAVTEDSTVEIMCDRADSSADGDDYSAENITIVGPLQGLDLLLEPAGADVRLRGLCHPDDGPDDGVSRLRLVFVSSVWSRRSRSAGRGIRRSANGAKQRDQPRESGDPQRQLKRPPKPEGRTYRFLFEKPTCDEKNRPEEHDAMDGHVDVKTFTRGTDQSAAAKHDHISRGGKYEADPQDEVVAPRVELHAGVCVVGRGLYWAAADSHGWNNVRLFDR